MLCNSIIQKVCKTHKNTIKKQLHSCSTQNFWIIWTFASIIGFFSKNSKNILIISMRKILKWHPPGPRKRTALSSLSMMQTSLKPSLGGRLSPNSCEKNLCFYSASYVCTNCNDLVTMTILPQNVWHSLHLQKKDNPWMLKDGIFHQLKAFADMLS